MFALLTPSAINFSDPSVADVWMGTMWQINAAITAITVIGSSLAFSFAVSRRADGHIFWKYYLTKTRYRHVLIFHLSLIADAGSAVVILMPSDSIVPITVSEDNAVIYFTILTTFATFLPIWTFYPITDLTRRELIINEIVNQIVTDLSNELSG